MLNRRELLFGVLGGLAVGLVSPRRPHAQAAGVTTLTDRVSLVNAGGTNVVVLSTPDGLVVVDSGAPLPFAGRVATVFNTHWHLENTAGNEQLRGTGAAIVAHENTRLWMATPTWMPAEDRYRAPRPAAAHPTRTFYADGSTTSGGSRIDYGYLIEAHTSGDIYVFFRDSNVLAVGDVASPARDPELDWFTGAWIGGRVDALDRLLKLVDEKTRIVPGFGPVMSRAELQAERDVMKTVYDRVVERVRQGETPDDMFKAGVMNGLGRAWTDPRKFLYAVQKGLWAHHNKLSPDVV